MAIITYEGFENYSSFAAVKNFVGLDNYQTATILNSSDGTVTPRNNGSCLKLVSSAAGDIEYYPKAMISTPNGVGYNSSIVGFAWYAVKPASGSWATFTPIAAFCDSSGKPHFFVGINSNLQLQVRRWITGIAAGPSSSTTSDYAWNTAPRSYYYDVYRCGSAIVYNNFLSNTQNVVVPCKLTIALATAGGPVDTTNKFILLGSTTSLVTENAWNYIEIKFVLDNTGTSGSIQVKLNRNSSDSSLDIDVSNVRTSTQDNSLCSKVAFGIFWGHNAAANASSASLGWTTYIDDIYWADLTGENNNFLGRVSCKKFSYDSVTSYNMTTPGNSGTALSNFNEAYAGSGTMNTRNIGNVVNQTLNVRSTGVSSETLSPIFVRQYVHGYKTEANSDISIGTTDGVNSLSVSGININNDSISGILRYRDYDNAPDGNEWTNSKLASTTFIHTISST
jgi:hypothetical protein